MILKDPVKAHISPACLPYLSIIPPSVGALILVYYALDSLFSSKPLFLQKFAAEEGKQVDDTGSRSKTWNHSTAALFLLTLLGLGARTVSVIRYAGAILEVLSLLSWVRQPAEIRLPLSVLT